MAKAQIRLLSKEQAQAQAQVGTRTRTRDPETRSNYTTWGMLTEVDEENQKYIVHVPFADPELPYYPVQIAAVIAGRSATTMYAALRRGRFGLVGVMIEDVIHITHDSLTEYLKGRDASAEEIIRRKRESLLQIPKTKARRRPTAPVGVSATHNAQHLIATGVMDFLDGIAPASSAAGSDADG